MISRSHWELLIAVDLLVQQVLFETTVQIIGRDLLATLRIDVDRQLEQPAITVKMKLVMTRSG